MISSLKTEEKKVLIVVTLFSIGGATETVVSLAAGLRGKGFIVDIITGPPLKNEGDMFGAATNLGLNVIVLPTMVRNIHPINDIKTLLKLIALIRKNQYTIVHTHSSKAGVLGRVSAWMTAVPVIIHTIHGLPYHNYQLKMLTKSYLYIEKLCAMISSKIICVTHAIVNNCVDNGIAKKEKFVVIRSGIPVENYQENISFRSQMRSLFQFKHDDIVAGVISRIAPLKGHEFIIQLAVRTQHTHPNLKYLLIGDGESGEYFRTEVISKKLQDIIYFSGMINPDEIPKMIAAVDFIIHPSLREGLARVLPQSIMMNKKVITLNLDGVNEVISDGISGYSVETGDVEALYLACLKIVRDDLPLHIDKKFRNNVMREFSDKMMVDQHVELYERSLVK